jgi:hypothetical protein
MMDTCIHGEDRADFFDYIGVEARPEVSEQVVEALLRIRRNLYSMQTIKVIMR